MRTKKITIIQHTAAVRPYALYAMLKQMNFDTVLSSFAPYLHKSGWTAPTEVTPLILLGGPQSVYEQEQHPWLLEEFAFVKKALDAGYPAIGICLGGQVLSHLLGAEVKRSSAPEVGWYPIDVCKGAEKFGISAGEKYFFQWHFDTFEFPKDSEPLFEGKGTCKNQGYVWKDQIISVQFHPEMTYEGAAFLREKFTVPAGTTLESCACLKTEFDNYCNDAQSVLQKMLNWFEQKI
jgi:GMP synthase-like glutamine amidotransferase